MSELKFVSNPTDVGPAAAGSGNGHQPRAIVPRPDATGDERPGSAPLSFAQQQVWLHALLTPGLPIYNQSLVLKHTGPFNRDALDKSLREMVRRHASLRTTFIEQDGLPAQVVAEQATVNLAVTDLSTLALPEREEQVRRIEAEELAKPFDLAVGPLMRTRLLRLADESHILIVTLHTIVADERSLDILAQELSALYESYTAGATSGLSELPLQYADFAAWQSQTFDDHAVEQQISYWRTRLSGMPTALDLPTDRPRPRAQTFRGASKSILLPNSLKGALEKLGEEQNVSLFVLLLSAFQTLLLRYTRQDDIVVGAVLPGRDEINIRELIGLFANVAVMRTGMSGDPSFRELVSRVNEVFAGACKHQPVPFDRLVKEVQPDRDPSRNPLFQVLFSLQDSNSELKSGWQIADLATDNVTSKVDLELELHTRPDGTEAHFTYSTDLFDGGTIVRMCGHFRQLLEGIVANPDEHISRFDLLTEAERRQLLVEWNDTSVDYPRDVPLHKFIEDQVQRAPNAIAVVYENEQITYSQLNSRANQLAHRLKKLGVGPDVLVAVCAERSVELVVALLAAIKAGGAYVPLDPEYPRERLQTMHQDTGSPVLLTQEHLLDRVAGLPGHVILLDRDWETLQQESTGNLPADVGGKNLAYAIYTSGSTGKPKGVPNVHEGIVNRLLWMQDMYQLTPEDRVLQKTPYSFDVSVWEFFWPLMMGATLVVARPGGHKDPAYLVNLIAEQKITTLHFVPSMLSIFLEADGLERCRSVRQVFASGEALSFELQQRFFERLGAQLHNLYGPTEAAVDVTYWTCRPDSQQSIVPIGRPVANTQIYILDASLQPVPIGVAGELHIGGIQLARGYLNRPDLTAQKFITSPFGQAPTDRLYKTGDLARFLPDGNIEYLGRIDHQVKLRGFRIELGEIEAVLGECAGVLQAVVIVREDKPGDKRLVAYLIPASGHELPVDSIRNEVKAKLPEYMVPSRFVILNEVPMTTSGKVDRKALPAPDAAELASDEKLVAPRDPIEAQLVNIWESILGVSPIGINHNFFELGGHSLLAVKLMRRIEQTFGKNLPLATLLQAPTIEPLAAILRQKGWSPQWCCLVPIQTGGSKPTFFCVHGANGAVVRFHDLARYLGADHNFYGLQAHGLDPTKPCHTRTEEMAAHYIEEMRRVQPEGPYFLGGYSFGGMIAFEMAQQLRAQGQDGTVVLFDTFCPPPPGSAVPQQTMSRSAALLGIFRIPARERLAYLWRILTVPNRMINRWLHVARLPRIVKKVRNGCLQAQANYTPQPYAGRVILFRSSHKPLGQVSDPRAAWSTYATQGLEIHEITSNHENILLEPQVRLVAQQLRTCLNGTNGSAAQAMSADSASSHVLA